MPRAKPSGRHNARQGPSKSRKVSWATMPHLPPGGGGGKPAGIRGVQVPEEGRASTAIGAAAGISPGAGCLGKPGSADTN